MKRQRGRGRKPGGGHHNHQHQHHHPNRAMESSGPDVKVRGPAAHIYERYLQLARDAASSGDRVLSENYLQHADHYFRLVRAMQPAMPPPQPDRFNGDGDFEGEEEGAPEAEGAEAAAAESDQPDVEFPQGGQPQQFERGEGDFRRRRGRRSRFRPEGEREGGEEREDRPQHAEGERAERNERPERSEQRRERAPRDRDGESAGPEGFSSGPKPAFLRSGD